MGLSIVKELTNEITIYDSTSGSPVRQFTEDAALFLTSVHRSGGVYVVDSLGQSFDIDLSQLVSTQILPAAAVPFSGTARQLYELLEGSFFYNVVNGGGGGVGPDPTNITTVVAATYNILTTDYIIICKANTTLTLPTAPTIGTIFKIKAVGVSVKIVTGGADLLDSKTEAKIRNQSALELRYYATNNYGIF